MTCPNVDSVRGHDLRSTPALFAPVRSPASTRAETPRGQAVILFALCLVLLLGCAALSIDGARLYAEGLRVQKAADSAALAAVVQGSLRGDVAGQVTAQSMVTRNLPLAAGAAVSVSSTLTAATTNQEKVVVQEQGFPLLFAPVIGLRSATITREGTAQYQAPVPMGNPTNVLGDTFGGSDPTISTTVPDDSGDPVSATVQAVHQNLTLSINGPDQWSESGDPYSPLYVLGDQPAVPGLPAAQTIRNPLRPSSFDGYDYSVTLPSGITGTTYLQVYDAETCHGNGYSDSLLSSQYGLPYANLPQTYPPSSWAPYPTYYRLYWIDPATGNRTGAFPPQALLDRGPVTDGSLPPSTVIAPTEGVQAQGTCNSTFNQTWYTLARLDASQAGQYLINVSTCLGTDPYGSPGDRGPNGYGTLNNCHGTEVNNFALRAITTYSSTTPTNFCTAGTLPDCQTFTSQATTIPGTTTPISQPQLAALGRISIEVKAAGTSVLYLAKLSPVYAGKWLLIKLYDPGDVTGSSSMQVVRPDGSYAPFEWYTQTLDGAGTLFQTAMQNSQNQSLVTSYTSGSPPPYTTPPYSGTVPLCPSQVVGTGTVPTGAPGYGQSMAEANPFDPLHTDTACFSTTDGKDWSSQPNPPRSHRGYRPPPRINPITSSTWAAVNGSIARSTDGGSTSSPRSQPTTRPRGSTIPRPTLIPAGGMCNTKRRGPALRTGRSGRRRSSTPHHT